MLDVEIITVALLHLVMADQEVLQVVVVDFLALMLLSRAKALKHHL
jgi:hypothetical protein